jgi:hypothetical protein
MSDADEARELLRNATPEQINAIIAEQERNREQQLRSELKGTWAENGHLSKDQLRRMASSVTFARQLLQEHPFYPVREALDQVDVSYAMLMRSEEEVIRQYGAFHGSLRIGGVKNWRNHELGITWALFGYCFAAFTLVQAYRTLSARKPEIRESASELKESIFGADGLPEFVQGLRNCFGHVGIIMASPMGQTTFGDAREVTSQVRLDKREVEAAGNFNDKAKKFIESTDELDVLRIVEEYTRRCSRFYSSYLSHTGLLKDSGFVETARCREAIAAMPNIGILNLVVNQVASSGADPFSYLAYYFSEKEIERIRCFDTGSDEQINYMLNVADPLGLCGADLIEKIRVLFRS